MDLKSVNVKFDEKAALICLKKAESSFPKIALASKFPYYISEEVAKTAFMLSALSIHFGKAASLVESKEYEATIKLILGIKIQDKVNAVSTQIQSIREKTGFPDSALLDFQSEIPPANFNVFDTLGSNAPSLILTYLKVQLSNLLSLFNKYSNKEEKMISKYLLESKKGTATYSWENIAKDNKYFLFPQFYYEWSFFTKTVEGALAVLVKKMQEEMKK